MPHALAKFVDPKSSAAGTGRREISGLLIADQLRSVLFYHFKTGMQLQISGDRWW